MSTLAEIAAAIEKLPESDVEKLAVFLEKRRSRKASWPVPPPNVDRAELERIEAEIEAEFPTLRKRTMCLDTNAGETHPERCHGSAATETLPGNPVRRGAPAPA